jgi:hypothetical protein
MGYLLDIPRLTRPQRAVGGGIFLFATSMGIWGGGLVFQKWNDAMKKPQSVDFEDARTYAGPCLLYIFYGMMDAFWQSASSITGYFHGLLLAFPSSLTF